MATATKNIGGVIFNNEFVKINDKPTAIKFYSSLLNSYAYVLKDKVSGVYVVSATEYTPVDVYQIKFGEQLYNYYVCVNVETNTVMYFKSSTIIDYTGEFESPTSWNKLAFSFALSGNRATWYFLANKKHPTYLSQFITSKNDSLIASNRSLNLTFYSSELGPAPDYFYSPSTVPPPIPITSPVTLFPDDLLPNTAARTGITSIEPLGGTAYTPLSTFWTNANELSWVYVDLGQLLEVGYVNIEWGTNYATSFTVQVSENSFTWTTVSESSNNSITTNTIGVSQATRFIKFQGITSSSSGYIIKSFKAYGRNKILPVEPLLATTTDLVFESINTTLSRNITEKVFTFTALKDFIFKYKSVQVLTSVYPTDQGSSYALDINTLETSVDGVKLILNTALKVDINITVLLSLERRVVHISVPHSIRIPEIEYTHNIEYLNLQPEQFFIIEPLNRTGVKISAAIHTDNNVISVHIKENPRTTFLPIRMTVYTEPHTFDTKLDDRLNIDKVSTYTLNQSFDTVEKVQYKDLRIVNDTYNYVPVSSETFILPALVNSIPIIIPVITQDGDLVALDTPNSSITFTSQTIGSKLEPFAVSSADITDAQVTVTLYRRTQFEESIYPAYNVHDLKFINKIVPLTQQTNPLRNLTLTQIDETLKIDVYGTNEGTVEFTPVVWGQKLVVNEIKGVAELFRQDVIINSKKSVNITATDTIQLGTTTFVADKTIIGGGTIIEFTVDTTTNEITTLNPTLPLDISAGVFTVTIGSLQLSNFITFNINITKTSSTAILTVDQNSLKITGYTNTTVDMEIYIGSTGVTKTIQISKFVGLPGSSITLNTSTDDKIFNDLEANDVNVSGLTIATSLLTNSINTINLLKNDNILLAVNANTKINSKNIEIGPSLNFLSDNLRLSLDSKYTLVDNNGNDVVIGKEIFIDTKTDVLNIKKIPLSVLPSIITLDTMPTTQNIYLFEDSGEIRNIGTLVTTYTNDSTLLNSSFTEVQPLQKMLDKTKNLEYVVDDFYGDSLTLTSDTSETATTITKTFKSSDNTISRVETYNIKIVTSNGLLAGDVLIRSGLSYNSNNPIESTETHTTETATTTYHKVSSNTLIYDREYTTTTDGYISFRAQFKISDNSVKMKTSTTSAKIQLNNIKPGSLLTSDTFSGEIELRNNAPKIKSRQVSYTVFETDQFFETTTDTGLKTIHGTFVNSSVPVSTLFSRNTLSSTYQDQEEYDSFTTDVGIIDLTSDAVFIFSSDSGVITSSNFEPTEIIPGTYTSETGIQITIGDTITVPDGIYESQHVQVQKNPVIKPHGPHDKYIPPQLLQLNLTTTTHTETQTHTPENIYDIRYIGPWSLLDFYCEGVWYPQFKLSNSYLDAHIVYINGTPKTTELTELAVNPFENKKSLESYSISLLATERVQALRNAGVALTASVQTPKDTNRDLPVENASSLSWIKSKSVGSIDYTDIFKKILDYTTLFDSSTDYSTVIETLKTESPQATELRRALFDVSPINNSKFNKYVTHETEQYTQVDTNWSRGLQVVGDRYISRIKNAILDINNIKLHQIDAILNYTNNDDGVSFPVINGTIPRYDFETSRLLSLAALIKHAPGSVKPGRWIKTGNTIWITADITVPTILENTVYTISGNPFSSVVRGVQVPIIPDLQFTSNTYEPPADLQYITPTATPDYLLDTSESPLPVDNITRVNTDGTITLGNNPSYTELTHNRHKFCGTFNIIETFPDLPSNEYTIPQDTDLSEYNYTLDNSGSETFAGYKLRSSPAEYNNGIYTL